MRSYAASNNSDRLRSPESKPGQWSSAINSLPSHGSAAQPTGSKYLSAGSAPTNGSGVSHRDARSAAQTGIWQQSQGSSAMDIAAPSLAAREVPGVVRYSGNHSDFIGGNLPSGGNMSAYSSSASSSTAASGTSNWTMTSTQSGAAHRQSPSASASAGGGGVGGGGSAAATAAGGGLSTYNLASTTRFTSRRETPPSKNGSFQATTSGRIPPGMRDGSNGAYTSSTSSIHRDLDSVLDDIKRELGKSRPEQRLSQSIDGASAMLSPSRPFSASSASSRAHRPSAAAAAAAAAAASSSSSSSSPLTAKAVSSAKKSVLGAAADAADTGRASALTAASPGTDDSKARHKESIDLFAASRDTIAFRIDALRARLEASRHVATSSDSTSTPSVAPTSSSSTPNPASGRGVPSSHDATLTSSQASAAPSLPQSERGSVPPIRSDVQSRAAPSIEAPGQSAKDKEALANGQSVQLAEGWEMKLDSPSGRIFYVNHNLKAITWEPPLINSASKSSSSKTAALDQLSERTKALGAKLRDEMKQATEERRNAAITSSQHVWRSTTASSTGGGAGGGAGGEGGGADSGKMSAASSVPSRLDSLVNKGVGGGGGAGLAGGMYGSLGEMSGATGGDPRSLRGDPKQWSTGSGALATGGGGAGGGGGGGRAHGGGMYSSFGSAAEGGGEHRWNAASSTNQRDRAITSGGGLGGGGAGREGGAYWQGAGGRGGKGGEIMMRSSLDSAKLSTIDKLGRGGGEARGRDIGDDATLSLLTKASSSLWHHLLGGSAGARRHGGHDEEKLGGRDETWVGHTVSDLKHFDDFVKALSQSTPRELDESPVKKSGNEDGNAADTADKAATKSTAPAAESNEMAWQV